MCKGINIHDLNFIIGVESSPWALIILLVLVIDGLLNFIYEFKENHTLKHIHSNSSNVR
jgi:hypothetical protein